MGQTGRSQIGNKFKVERLNSADKIHFKGNNINTDLI